MKYYIFGFKRTKNYTYIKLRNDRLKSIKHIKVFNNDKVEQIQCNEQIDFYKLLELLEI